MRAAERMVAELARIADALEYLARRERRRPCRHCGIPGCEGHAGLPDAEGPFVASAPPAPAALASVGLAHQEISAAAALIVETEARAKAWQQRYREPIEAADGPRHALTIDRS